MSNGCQGLGTLLGGSCHPTGEQVEAFLTVRAGLRGVDEQRQPGFVGEFESYVGQGEVADEMMPVRPGVSLARRYVRNSRAAVLLLSMMTTLRLQSADRQSLLVHPSPNSPHHGEPSFGERCR